MTVSASTLIAVTTRILKIGITATYITYVFVARAILGQTVKVGRRQSHDIGTQESTPAEKTDTFTRKLIKLLIIYRGVWEMYRNAFIYQRSITVP